MRQIYTGGSKIPTTHENKNVIQMWKSMKNKNFELIKPWIGEQRGEWDWDWECRGEDRPEQEELRERERGRECEGGRMRMEGERGGYIKMDTYQLEVKWWKATAHRCF